MRFLMKIFYFLSVFHYVITESEIESETKSDTESETESEDTLEFTFNAASLGHSGLLITWKPNTMTPSKELAEYYEDFEFSVFIVRPKNDAIFEPDDSNLIFFGGNNKCSKPQEVKIDCKSNLTSFKIHSLNESTFYKVYIWVKHKHSQDKQYNVQMTVRTNSKSDRTPAKPYFSFISNLNVGTITWHPCGIERICHDQESGTHFGIKIRELYSTRKANQMVIEEFDRDYKRILFLPGRMYEVVVYSVNGKGRTDSDSQEIFLKPRCSPVQHVNVISLPDLSVLISWDSPKQSMEEPTSYMVLNFNSSKEDCVFDSFENKNFIETHHYRYRISGLIPEVTYTLIILPLGENGVGFEYEIKHKLHVYDHDLPIARPDFTYKKSSTGYNSTCYLTFCWLPCGQFFDCKNSRPGSQYLFQFEPKPIHEREEEYCECHEIRCHEDLVYEVTLKSVIGSNFSESVIKKFKNCTVI